MKPETSKIKEFLLQQGFSEVGVSKVEELKDEASFLKDWLDNGYHGEMKYMENHFEKRTNPALLVEGAKSVISVLYEYYPEKLLPEENNYKISKYAYGPDYHDVIKKKLFQAVALIEEVYGAFTYRAFVDSAPVMDKVWAEKSGLGWIGKNTCLINRKLGSFVFIGHLIVDFELDYDHPINAEYCGNCTRCIDACPTKAIIKPGVIDSNLCLSYLTIEYRGEELPEIYSEKAEDWIYGCDICQDVCPWNRFKVNHIGRKIEAHPELYNMNKEKWHEIDPEKFNVYFRKSAVKRTKYSGLSRNISSISKY